jgi:stage II sporulation protein AA (anti-sigma F factor antagonist)
MGRGFLFYYAKEESDMSLRLETDMGVLTALLGGEIDHHTAKELREGIDHAASEQKPGKLVLDFREVTFMDSSGIGLVMGRYRLMRELGGEMAVDRPNERILKILRLSGMERFFEICHAPKGEKR